ncbi:pentatricopeptide repeat-containing protein At2g13600-like [Papaver somniferum]|uniref:pentatricopeptide repeat-containing protein At2g13600-like n=1 Tax=Papaver somniferum TaxID=3469 RepID=UPI000E6FFF63|nr:pentatricopeptide repeat-containing protein At2g13600-like [Papaver somniferum]XP_026404432.1 pentatricopeptide repeat-containing protein At2g13600-like [Papaver somniferum]
MKRSQLALKNLKFFTSYPAESSKFLWPRIKNHLHTLSIHNLQDPIAIANALKISSSSKSVTLGNKIHARVIKLGFSENMFSQNNLIIMYTKCGVLGNGLQVFDEMTDRNLVSWTSITSGCIQNGESALGLEIFTEMIENGFRPNEFAFGSVLRGCTSLEDIKFGSSVHCLALKNGSLDNHFVISSLLYMYAKCGYVGTAERVFECIKDYNVGCWNTMIEGYALNGYSYEALQLLCLMNKKKMAMDQLTFISAIKGCSSLGNLNFGRQIHAMVIQSEVKLSSSVMNSLVDMYFKVGEKVSALKVFSQMHEKDVASWNTVLSEFAHEGDAMVVDLFTRMLRAGLYPNRITFSILFRLCGSLVDLSLGFQLYCLAYHLGFTNEPIVANSLINLFSKCGKPDIAKYIFIGIPCQSITSWNEMIMGFNLNGCTMEALELFANLWKSGMKVDECTICSILGTCTEVEHIGVGRQIHGVIIKSGFCSQNFVCSSLINTYGRFGLVEDCFVIFRGIERLDLALWGTMIYSLVRGGRINQSLDLLKGLIKDGQKPDEFILGSILNGCADVAAHTQTKSVHSIVIKIGFGMNLCVASAVIDSYAKCGDIESSRIVFNQSVRYADCILFNTMIMAYARHGLVTEAIAVLEEMKQSNLQPSHSTFVSVISMCSHLGLVEQGQNFFDTISSVYGMVPSAGNYGCLVDLFSRNGYLEKAKCVLETMPFAPWPAVWRSFLSGCRTHGKRELGEWASKQLLELVPENDAAYTLLSKIYSDEGSWEDAAKVRLAMNESEILKKRGYSWMEL